MRLYLSGPMTGLPEFNFPAFHLFALKLRERGHTVWNPAEQFNGETHHARELYLLHDIHALTRGDIDALAVLPGYETSEGALLEIHVAKACGIPVLDADTLKQLEAEPVTSTAERLVHGDRGEDYGHPYHDFSRTAMFWSELFGCIVTARQVGLAMMLLKLSREIHRPKLDNLIDACGYALTVQKVDEYERDHIKGYPG